MKKRIVSLLLSVCLVATMLVGCGGSTPQTSLLSNAWTKLDLGSTSDAEFEDFLSQEEVEYENSLDGFYSVTDSLLGYDAEYSFFFDGDVKDLNLKHIWIYVHFDSQADLDEGKELIKNHLESRLGLEKVKNVDAVRDNSKLYQMDVREDSTLYFCIVY